MDPTTQFLQQGILGAIIVVLSGVVWYQNNKIDKKDSEIKDGQEKRLLDSQQYSTSFLTTTKDMVSVNKDLTAQVSTLQNTNETLVTTIQRLLEKIGDKL